MVQLPKYKFLTFLSSLAAFPHVTVEDKAEVKRELNVRAKGFKGLVEARHEVLQLTTQLWT